MQAVYQTSYGWAESLNIKEIPVPVPKENEILIKVYTTTLNRTDCAIIPGRPFIMRLFTGLFKPSSSVPGTDFAGVIEKVGIAVKEYQAGDRVFGFEDTGLASMAEYITIATNKPLSIIPESLKYEEAVACLEGVHYAINFINKVSFRPNQKVLVNGATGAIGSALVQLLKTHSLIVHATCDTHNIPLVKSLGADKVIDYTQTDFINDGEQYDFIFDAVGKSTFGKCKPLLNKKGIYISSELGPGIQNPFLALITPFLGGKKVMFPFPSNIRASIHTIKELIAQGKFKPVIDRIYNMKEIREAFTYVSSGKKTGNVIIQFNK